MAGAITKTEKPQDLQAEGPRKGVGLIWPETEDLRNRGADGLRSSVRTEACEMRCDVPTLQ